MVFYWNKVEALARYASGDVVVILEQGQHSDGDMSIETAISLATEQYRKYLWENCYIDSPAVGELYPSWFDENDIAEFDNKIKAFQEELRQKEPIGYIFSTAILFQGSD